MTASWHVVIDARAALLEMDGLGNYLRQQVPRVVDAREFRCSLLVNPEMEKFWADTAPRATIIASDCRPMILRQHWEIPRILARLRPDLFFYPAHDPPLLLTTPFVFTIHDLTPYQVRPYFERHDWAKTAYLRFITSQGLRRARAVFAVSQATKIAIGDFFGAEARSKTVVTLNGASPPLAVTSNRERRFLYVGTDRPHKNLDRLVAAYSLAARRSPGLPALEIVGGLRRDAHLRDIIARHGVNDRVVLRGHLDARELEACYAAALALVMPSLSEGFGIPIVEAMGRGVPVITSATSGCAEVAGDAALLVDPTSVDSIAKAMSRMHADEPLRHDLVAKARARVTAFDWACSADVTLKTLTSVLASL